MKKQSLQKKHQIVTLMLLLFITPAIAQDILWEKSYGGKHADYLFDVIPTPDYGFILAGSSLSKKTGNKNEDNRGDLDYWVWKMDEKGDLDWQKSFGGSGQDKLRCVLLTNDGGFLLAGSSDSEVGLDKKEKGRGENDFWIIKLNAKGGEEWQKTIGGSGQDELNCLARTKDGGYVIGGSSNSDTSGEKKQNGFGGMDYWVIRIDTKGKIVWQNTFGGQYNDELRSIVLAEDGGFVLAGNSNSTENGTKTQKNLGQSDYWVIKLDKDGNERWQKTIGGTGDDQLFVVHTSADGNYLLGGNSNSESGYDKRSSNESGTDFWVIKLAKDGKEILWQETYNIAKVDVLTSLVENKDKTILLGGYAQGESSKGGVKNGTDDYVVIKISEKGEELWRKEVGSDGQDILKKAIETRDGGYLLAGTSNPQASSSSSVKQNTKELIKGISYSNGQNQYVQDIKNDINKEITNTTNDVNSKIKSTTADGVNTVNESLGLKNDSPLKLAANDSSNSLNLSKIGDGKGNSNPLAGLSSNPMLPASGDKKKSMGNYDFWVVKLKDKQKPKEEKKPVEAIPNPATNFTNVIVGYDFTKGTATVVDLAGHILQQFEITERTVPIDLQSYPEGIYVVNIKTDVQNSGVKIIKKISKN